MGRFIVFYKRKKIDEARTLNGAYNIIHNHWDAPDDNINNYQILDEDYDMWFRLARARGGF